MISTKMLVKAGEKFLVDNAPTILTVVGCVGTAATAYLTHKATFSSALILMEEDAKRHIETKDIQSPPVITRTETFKLTWKEYIPPVACGVGTITAIVMANRISAKRAAALAAAYALSQDRFGEYKEKMQDKLGIKKEQAARDELAQQRTDTNPPASNMIIGDGKVLCREEFTGRYFQSTVEKIKRSENEINAQINDINYATLSDFYEKIGLPPTSISETFGWNSPDQLDLSWSTVLTPDGQPCVTFDINAKPVKDYGECSVK